MTALCKLAVALAALPLWQASAAALPGDALAQSDSIGGIKAQPGSDPFVVSINKSNMSWCAGALVNANTVVTAAHCLHEVQPSDLYVRAGSTNWNTGGVKVAISRFITNPNFNYDSGDSDIGMLHLAAPIHAGAGISYVTLPAQGSAPAPGTNIVVSGWGATGFDKNGKKIYPLDRHDVTLPVAATGTCQAAYNAQDFDVTISGNMFCAGSHAPGHSTCTGDSGSPAVDARTKVLWGIDSMGPENCGAADFYTTFVKVGNFVNWINQNKA